MSGGAWKTRRGRESTVKSARINVELSLFDAMEMQRKGRVAVEDGAQLSSLMKRVLRALDKGIERGPLR